MLPMQMALPVAGYDAIRTRHRLPIRVARGCGKHWTGNELASPIVVEPLLARLVALDDGMPGLFAVGARMLAWRVVATADVSAGGASPEVKPPSRLGPGEALDAPVTAWGNFGVDVCRRRAHRSAFWTICKEFRRFSHVLSLVVALPCHSDVPASRARPVFPGS